MDLVQPSRMVTENMREQRTADRRKSPRYALENDVFLFFRPNFGRIGRLINVSSRGLAFEYSSLGEHENVADVEVDIFTDQPRKLVLPRVSCKVVYDISLEPPTFDGVETRLCGIKFNQLSQTHSDLLKALLGDYVPYDLANETIDSESEISRSD